MGKKTIKKRIIIGIFILLSTFFLLIYRLYHIQIQEGEDLGNKASLQRGREFPIYPKRGIIFDRKLRAITNSESQKTVIVERDIIINDNNLYQVLKKTSSLNEEEFKSILKSNNRLVQIPIEKYQEIDHLDNIFFVDIIKRYARENPLAHVIGYINQSDGLGRSGIEYVYDEFLKDKHRRAFLVEYDRDRNIILGGSQYISDEKESIHPTAVQLTIDLSLQKYIEKILDRSNYTGAVIVNDIKTGEILSMVSRPNFDQNNIGNHLKRADLSLYNRAIQIGYPPGSIFKIVVLLAALEEDIDHKEDMFYCPGYEIVNGRKTNCTSIHGHLTIREAFAKSCNSSFIQLGKKIGSEKIISMAKKLGFSSKLNIGLIEEEEGNLPSYNNIIGGAIRNISIGQGDIEVTPLQVNNLVTILANRGIRKDLSIVKAITNNEGLVIKKYILEEDKKVLSQDSAEIVLEYMREVVRIGTAKAINLETIGDCGGKTGSAEAVFQERETVHGWFTGFYPSNDPHYAITILIENSNIGSAIALPIFENIAKEIWNIYGEK